MSLYFYPQLWAVSLTMLYQNLCYDDTSFNESLVYLLLLVYCREEALLHKNEYYFSVDGDAQLENRDTVQNLIERNR